MRYVLASGSPRRREILTRLGFVFEVHKSDVPEDDIDGTISQVVQRLSERKAESVRPLQKDALIIAADTLVGIEGKKLGKPESEQHAFDMLKSLSGKTHEVSTGLCLINTVSEKKIVAADTTYVTFRDLSDEEILAYVKTGEPMDKAGSYAIQGGAAGFVKQYTGSYDNIVGFPSELFLSLLKEME